MPSRSTVCAPPSSVTGRRGSPTSQAMGELGFDAAAERIMRTSLTRDLRPRPRNWKLGEALVGSARHWELFRDRAYIRRATPFLARHLERVARQLASSRRGL